MKPIGYWLNRTDQAITRYMNGMLQEFGLTRVAWQVLNVVHDTPEATDVDVRSALSANADIHTLTAAVETVLADGWASRPAPERLTLTRSGRRRLNEVAERVATFRDLSTSGISPDEYRTAVLVLERMALNLETATGADLTGQGAWSLRG
ncbi:MarR family winged helix-turn-helix transcriptional regulator [Streptomyces sp. NRRL S-146]|uniref:MarR family winged helix-turn-helix transcriptional regulator n=1 Tax=Streptomyces sp. NRRL S-146 TaxID=1463884 RepID=UPI00068BFBAD|nr:MarR family winged helix-turn-helix transcriptional regulator [Streptomyces sp. NRRL S-146]